MPCDIDFFFLDFIIKNSYLTTNIKKWPKNSLFHVLYLVRAGVLHRTKFILRAELGGKMKMHVRSAPWKMYQMMKQINRLGPDILQCRFIRTDIRQCWVIRPDIRQCWFIRPDFQQCLIIRPNIQYPAGNSRIIRPDNGFQMEKVDYPSRHAG